MEKQQGKNPGLSPEAWIKFHRRMAAAHIKYREVLQRQELKKAN